MVLSNGFVKPSTTTGIAGPYSYKNGMSSPTQSYIDNSFPNILDKTGDNITGLIFLITGGGFSGGFSSINLNNINELGSAVSSYNMSATDFIVGANTSSSPVAITVPAPILGKVIGIKDISNNAAANNISIVHNSTERIDGISLLTLSHNSSSILLISDGINWYSITRF